MHAPFQILISIILDIKITLQDSDCIDVVCSFHGSLGTTFWDK